METRIGVWFLRVGLPIFVAPGILFSGKLLLEGQYMQGAAILGIQAPLFFWIVRAWLR